MPSRMPSSMARSGTETAGAGVRVMRKGTRQSYGGGWQQTQRAIHRLKFLEIGQGLESDRAQDSRRKIVQKTFDAPETASHGQGQQIRRPRDEVAFYLSALLMSSHSAPVAVPTAPPTTAPNAGLPPTPAPSAAPPAAPMAPPLSARCCRGLIFAQPAVDRTPRHKMITNVRFMVFTFSPQDMFSPYTNKRQSFSPRCS
jgi:hypothetical protein